MIIYSVIVSNCQMIPTLWSMSNLNSLCKVLLVDSPKPRHEWYVRVVNIPSIYVYFIIVLVLGGVLDLACSNLAPNVQCRDFGRGEMGMPIKPFSSSFCWQWMAFAHTSSRSYPLIKFYCFIINVSNQRATDECFSQLECIKNTRSLIQKNLFYFMKLQIRLNICFKKTDSHVHNLLLKKRKLQFWQLWCHC